MKADLTILLNGVAALTTGDTTVIGVRGVRGLYGVAQASISGSATVKVYGRLSSAFPWKEITTFTSSDAIEVVLFPEMKADVTVYGSGAVSVGVLGSI